MPGASIAFEWMQTDTDHSFCKECKNMIFGTMHVLCLFVDNVKQTGEAKYCEECYMKLPKAK